MRNLPSAAAAALDPVVVLLVGDLQQDLDHGGIGLRDVLALPEMTCGCRVGDRNEPDPRNGCRATRWPYVGRLGAPEGNKEFGVARSDTPVLGRTHLAGLLTHAIASLSREPNNGDP